MKTKEDIVKKICEIMNVKYSHFDDHMSDDEYFPQMKFDSPVRIVCYSGMSPWEFAILEDMRVVTSTTPFSEILLKTYDHLEEVEGSEELQEKYKKMADEVRDELERLREAEKYLIENECHKILLFDQPDPDSGVSSYELGRALGKSMDEALDFQNDIENLVKPNKNK